MFLLHWCRLHFKRFYPIIQLLNKRKLLKWLLTLLRCSQSLLTGIILIIKDLLWLHKTLRLKKFISWKTRLINFLLTHSPVHYHSFRNLNFFSWKRCLTHSFLHLHNLTFSKCLVRRVGLIAQQVRLWTLTMQSFQ